MPVPGEVRCLGPGPEHTFYSLDRIRCRVCKNCSVKMNQWDRMVRLTVEVKTGQVETHQPKAT